MAIKNLVVEDGIPIPPPLGLGYGLTATLRSMEVGQSVLIPGKQRPSDIGPTISVVRKEGRNFTARAVEGGVRVWRVEPA